MARPITYDVERVLKIAMDLFWANGFSRTSIDDIVRVTAINRHSLYQVFGGKNGLFLQVLTRYRNHYGQRWLNILEQGYGLAALRDYFEAVLSGADHRGCLLLNTAIELAGSDPACHRLLTQYYEQVSGALARAVCEGQREGSIRPGLDPDATARWLLRALQGLSVGARLGHTGESVPDLLALLYP